MPRGGYREKAGRKSGWVHRETQVIRVPVVFADKLIEIAKQLDEGTFIDSVTKSEELRDDSVTESKFELVTESLKRILASWRDRASKASPKNADWRKARQMLEELEPVVYDGVVLDSVIKSKEAPGQMNLLDQKPTEDITTKSNEKHIDSVTESILDFNDSVTESKQVEQSESVAIDSVTESDEWLSTKQCWEKLVKVLEKPPSYNTFRKLNPGKLQKYGIEVDLSRKEKYGGRWLRFSALS